MRRAIWRQMCPWPDPPLNQHLMHLIVLNQALSECRREPFPNRFVYHIYIYRYRYRVLLYHRMKQNQNALQMRTEAGPCNRYDRSRLPARRVSRGKQMYWPTHLFCASCFCVHFVPSELPNLRLETSKQTVCIFRKEVTWLATCIVTCRASTGGNFTGWPDRRRYRTDFSAPCGTAEKIWEMWKGSGKHKQSKQLLSSFGIFWHAGWNSMKFSLLGMSYCS